MKKTIHIVVKDGLVQEVYIDDDLDAEVFVYDLDTDDNTEYDKLYEEVDQLRKSGKSIY